MYNKRDVRYSVGKLPENLIDTYNEAIARIRLQDTTRVQLASKVLLWLSCSWRPLNVMELRSALAVAPGARHLDDEALPYEDDLVAVCMGLVYIERGSGIIALVHETTQKYFEYFRNVLFPDADEEINRTCLEYMMLIDRTTALGISGHGYKNEMTRYHLLQYAVPFWARHALKVKDSSLEPLVIQFIQQETSFHLLKMHMTNAMELPESLSVINATAFEKEYYPFLIACAYGLEKIAQSLVMAGIDPNGSAEAFIKPLHLAVCNGHIRIARWLVSHGVGVDAREAGVDRPIALAVRKGLSVIVETLIDGGARLDARGEGPWCSILELAILHQHESIVQLLLERGASVETEDYLERTALSCAASVGNATIVQLLLDHGAKIGARDPTGMTALHIAADSGLRTVAEVLLDHCASQTEIDILSTQDESGRIPLHYATSGEIVRFFVAKGAEIDARDLDGATPLLEAARSGREDVILALIELGSDPKAMDNEQETMLSILEASNNIDFIKQLLRDGIDRGKGSSDRTSLHWAVAFAEMRLARAVSEEHKDGLGRRASLFGSRNNYWAEITQEIRRGADINATDGLGNTPLHLAIRRWIMTPQVQRQSARLLLKKHANTNVQDASGNTPLHLAAASGKLKAVQLLIEFGANLHIRNNAGCTALELAIENKRSSPAFPTLETNPLYSATSDYETVDDGGYAEREVVIRLLERQEAVT